MTDTNAPSDPTSTPGTITLQGILLRLLAFAVYATHNAAIKQLRGSYSPSRLCWKVLSSCDAKYSPCPPQQVFF
jgi:S-adenosylmethionine uptake transporter